MFQDQYERDSPMYTTLEPATGGSVSSYTNLQLAPPSPSKYYPGGSTPSAGYPPYQYPHYSRPGYNGSGAPSQELLSTLYPGYTGQFSYDSLGSLGQQHSVYDTSGKAGYGGIYVPSAALPSKIAMIS